MVKKISVVILTLLLSFGFVFADSNYWSNAEKIGGFFVKEMELNPAVAFVFLVTSMLKVVVDLKQLKVMVKDTVFVSGVLVERRN